MKPSAIVTDKAPKAIGPYSQGMRVGPFAFFSGQVPLDPQSGLIVGKEIREQTRRVLENIRGMLDAVGCDFKQVVKTTVFLQSMGDFGAFNEVYAEYFSSPAPARSTVEVAALPKAALVEIECVVWVGE